VPGAIAGRVGGGAPFEQAFLMETGDTVERATARAWAAYRHFNTWVPILTSPSALWGLIVALAAVAFLYRRRRRELQRRIWDDEEERAEAADEDEPPPHPG
jgi:hypothetical protein